MPAALGISVAPVLNLSSFKNGGYRRFYRPVQGGSRSPPMFMLLQVFPITPANLLDICHAARIVVPTGHALGGFGDVVSVALRSSVDSVVVAVVSYGGPADCRANSGSRQVLVKSALSERTFRVFARAGGLSCATRR